MRAVVHVENVSGEDRVLVRERAWQDDVAVVLAE